MMGEEKLAPVQGYTAGIPWSMHLRAYDVYCETYSPQPALIDLEGMNCRGGFAVNELDEFIPGWREELSEITRLKARTEQAEAALERRADEAARRIMEMSDEEIMALEIKEVGRDAAAEISKWTSRAISNQAKLAEVMAERDKLYRFIAHIALECPKTVPTKLPAQARLISDVVEAAKEEVAAEHDRGKINPKDIPPNDWGEAVRRVTSARLSLRAAVTALNDSLGDG